MKYIFIILSLIGGMIPLGQQKIGLNNARIVWDYSLVEIPLGEIVDSYTEKVYPHLYSDETEIIATNAYFHRGINGTSESNIRTDRVVTYSIQYKIEYPEFGMMDQKTIIYSIVDLVAPRCEQLPSLSFALGSKAIDYKLGLIITDNYYVGDDISIIVEGTSSVNVNQIGTYSISYYYTDKSGNFGRTPATVTIYDDVSPNIELKKPLILEYGVPFTWINYFTIKDNYSSVPTVLVDDSLVKWNKIGRYLINLSATDESGNVSYSFNEIEIIDTSKPTLIEVKDPTIEVLTPNSLVNLESILILSISDNYDAVNDLVVTIESNSLNLDKIGTYDIVVKVVDTSLNELSKIIKVKVIDSIAPEVSLLREVVLELKTAKPYFQEYFQYTDNYNKLSELKIVIKVNINMDKVGFYQIELTVTDTSNNVFSGRYVVIVQDEEPPVIKQSKEIVITDFKYKDLMSFFSAVDNASKNILITIDYSRVDFTKLGEYILVVTAKDEVNNINVYNSTVTVVDNITPKLTLIPTVPEVNVFDPEVLANLRNYVFSYSDNYNIFTLDDIVVTHLIDMDRIGTYDIYYSLTDESGNKAEAKMKIKVVDRIKPIIYKMDDLIFLVDNEKPLFYPLFDITDNYNSPDELVIKYTEKVNMKTVGQYQLEVIATDTSGNKTTKSFMVTIVDNTPPEIIQLKEIVIIDFKKKDYTGYFSFYDNYSTKLVTIYNDSNVDYTTVGVYPFYIVTTDISGNYIELETEIYIVDSYPPVITLEKYLVNINSLGSTFDFIGNILLVSDNSSVISKYDCLIEETVDFSKVGSYEVIYSVSDLSGNYVSQSLIVIIDDQIRPTMYYEDYVSVKKGQAYDLDYGLEISDNNPNDFVKITHYPQSIDTQVEGNHLVTYILTDSRGNLTKYERTIKVQQENTINGEVLSIHIVTPVILSAGLVLFYFYKKRPKSKKK
jgi:hypothetical protein